MLKIVSQLYFCLSCFIGCAQSAEWRAIGPLPEDLDEGSGMVFFPPNSIVHVNDGGNNPTIITTDTIGNLIQNYCIPGASNRDWEDLTKDQKGNLYIGDFGNNNNTRDDLVIYKVPSSKVLAGDDSFVLEEIQFIYEDQKRFPPKKRNRNFDTEAMIHFDNYIYLFSKNRTKPFIGYTYCYRLPDNPGFYTAEKVDSFYTGNGPMEVDWITAADFNPDTRTLVLLGYNKLWMFYNIEGSHFFSGKHNVLYFNTFTQKESIAFKNNRQVYLTDEKNSKEDGLLYILDLPSTLNTPENTLTSGLDSADGVKISLQDSIIKSEIRLSIYSPLAGICNWEAFAENGQRMHFAKFSIVKTGSNDYIIDTEKWDAGEYTILVIVNNVARQFQVVKKKKKKANKN